MSNVCAKLSMAISHHLFLLVQEEWVMLHADQVYRRLANLLSEKLDVSYGEIMSNGSDIS